MQLVKGFILMISLFAFSNSISAQSAQSTAVVKNVDVSEFKNLMHDKNVVILDVRTPQEVAQGKIEGAKNINLFQDFETNIEKLDKSKTYLVYCRSGHRSAKATNIMANAGFTKIYNLLGGYNAWSR